MPSEVAALPSPVGVLEVEALEAADVPSKSPTTTPWVVTCPVIAALAPLPWIVVDRRERVAAGRTSSVS